MCVCVFSLLRRRVQAWGWSAPKRFLSLDSDEQQTHSLQAYFKIALEDESFAQSMKKHGLTPEQVQCTYVRVCGRVCVRVSHSCVDLLCVPLLCGDVTPACTSICHGQEERGAVCMCVCTCVRVRVCVTGHDRLPERVLCVREATAQETGRVTGRHRHSAVVSVGQAP